MNEEKKNKGIIKKVKEFPFLVIPIIIVMSIIVLIIRYYEFDPNLSQYNWYSNTDKAGDVFTYYKGIWLTVVARVMIAILIGALVYSKKFYFHKALIPLGVYAICIILSSVFSEYKYFVFNGMDGHFETVYVLLTYCLLVVYSFWFADSKKAVWTVIVGWIIGIVLMSIVGLLQLCKHDLVLTDFGKWLTMPKELLEIGGELGLAFPEGTVYLTLFNPNYVGYYAALVIPVLTVMVFSCKRKFVKCICLLLDAVTFVLLLGSNARNGIVAVAISICLLLVVFRKKVKKYWKITVVFFILFVVLFIGYERLNNGQVLQKFMYIFEDKKDEQGGLQKIETNDENVVICYNNNKLILMAEKKTDGTLFVHSIDESGKQVEYEISKENTLSYTIKDERFPFNVTIGKVNDYVGFAVDIDGKTWTFSNSIENAGYYFYNPYGKFTKIMEAEAVLFEDHSLLANGRGYLWARSIPLLKKYFFVGSGPDTFTITFPQEDYVAASKIGYDKILITKPHNLYLQIGVQTGAVSMIAFIIFNLIYLMECVKVYWKREFNDSLECLGAAIMLSVIAYLISGIINDSSITIAPVYWCLMGIGLSVNRLIKKGSNEQAENMESNENCEQAINSEPQDTDI